MNSDPVPNRSIEKHSALHNTVLPKDSSLLSSALATLFPKDSVGLEAVKLLLQKVDVLRVTMAQAETNEAMNK